MTDSTKDEINGTKIQMKIPLEDWVKDIAKEAGREAAHEVMEECKGQFVTKGSFNGLRVKFYILVAFLAGLGMLKLSSVFLG